MGRAMIRENLPAGRIAKPPGPDTDRKDTITAQVEREGEVGRLQELDDRLYALVHNAIKYRAAVHIALRQMRVGHDPSMVRVGLDLWSETRQKIKRLVGKL